MPYTAICIILFRHAFAGVSLCLLICICPPLVKFEVAKLGENTRSRAWTGQMNVGASVAAITAVPENLGQMHV